MYIDSCGQVRTGTDLLVARLLMEQYLSRDLTKDEVVHHKDENPCNNNLDNLQVMTRSEHMTFHRTGKPHSEETKNRMIGGCYAISNLG